MEAIDLMGFEGAEKKMEVIFSRAENAALKDDRGLRSFGLEHWSSVVATLNGSILLNDSLEEFDSYLISESSLFVYPDRVIMLTCGTTTLLKALPSILETGKTLNMDVCWFQYSRKNFLFPEKQLFPHKSFDQEVNFCSEMFSDGQAHILGPLNADHWVVFIADRIRREDEYDVRLDREQTLNIYMYGISQEIAQLFMKSEEMILPSLFDVKDHVKGESHIITKTIASDSHSSFSFVTSAEEATDRSGIRRLMDCEDGRVVHDHLFDPCGYSMNGVASKDRYWTIHITPEAHCSYVSFETNYAPSSYEDLVQKVVATFQPSRFTAVVQADSSSPIALASSSKLTHLPLPLVEGYFATGQGVLQIGETFGVQLVNFEAETCPADDASGSWTSSSSSSQSSMESDRC